MTQRIDEEVAVAVIFSKGVIPKTVRWSGRDYPVERVGMHHTLHRGDDLIHVFGVICKTHWMRLELDTKTLSWKLLEINDGQTN